MEKILLTLLAFGSMFFIFGCAHQMSPGEERAVKRYYDREFFWKQHPCYRLNFGDKSDLNECLRPDERHSREQLSEIFKQRGKELAEKVCKNRMGQPGCRDQDIDTLANNYRPVMVKTCKNHPDWAGCEDYWSEFSAWKCRIPDPRELEQSYREREESSRRFQEQVDRDFLLEILMDIDFGLIDLNSRMPLR